MIQINMVEPKGMWMPMEKWRGLYTFSFRQKGQMYSTTVYLMVWGLHRNTRAFYTAKKVKSVISYREN